MKRNSYKRFFVLGFLAYWVTVLYCGYWEIPVASFDSGVAWLFNILAVIGLTFHLLFFYKFSKYDPVFDVETIFTRICSMGFVALLISLLPNIVALLGWIPFLPKIVLVGLNEVRGYMGLLYFLYTLVLFRKLMYMRKDDIVIRLWNTWLAMLSFAAFVSMPFIKIPASVRWSAVVIGLLAFLPLLWRIKWIALLKGREKWLCLLFLAIFILLNIPFLYLLDIIHFLPEQEHTFLFLLAVNVNLYSLFSFFALLFYLPLSSVIEEQKTEIRSYQEISEALQRQESSKETLKRLFSVCFNNTSSYAGWLVHNTDNRGEILHTSDIKSEDIQQLSKRINFEQLVKIEPKNGYYSFPDLLNKRLVINNEMPYESLLVLPIFTKDAELKGVICLLKSFPYGFDKDNISLVKGYIDQAKLAFENNRLMEQTIEDARYKEEIEIATKVQETLIPSDFPDSEFFEVAAFSRSAKDVGGDYYDISEIDDFRVAFVIGDVSGKGAAAAFHMAQMKGIFQSLMQLCLPADNFLVMANQALSNCLEKKSFVTLIYITFDFAFNRFTYSRGGHCPLLYYNAERDKVEYLKGEGLGLGIIRNNSYTKFVEALEYDFNEGDIFVLYTDGLVEGRKSDDEEQFGYERLKYCLEGYKHESAGKIKEAIHKKFLQFTNGREDTDDTALLVIKIKKVE